MLHITTLGGLAISVNGQPIPRSVTAKALALLSYLAVTARPHTREALLALLWPEMDETEAQNNLRQSLFQLKKYAEPYLIVTRAEVSFDRAQPHWLDVDALERMARTNGPANPDENTTLLTGEFLQGLSVRNAAEFEEWITGQRARFSETAAQVLLQRARSFVAQAQLPAALNALTPLLARDPWREEAHRDKMRLLARDGQTSAALAQFAICKEALRRELAIPPAPETRRLAERIAQAQERPALSVPTEAASFVGRRAECDELAQRLAFGDARLISLLGPGGMGKTRLALEVLRHLRHAFLEGAHFVSLQGATDATKVLPTLLESLNLPAARNPLQALTDFLREKEMLLVLDNFEPVLDAAPDLAKLLQAAPGLRLLVTSRERLNLRWEEAYELSGLLPSDAENLFIARVRGLLSTFAPTAADQEGIQRVCAALEGVPLAIELASSMARARPIHAIADELTRDLDALISPMRDAPERQRSLRVVFDHSWAALAEAERVAVRQLSVFRGGFSAEAALAVANANAPMLAQLTDKSFIHQPSASDELPRYNLHEVLRAFAHEALTQADEAAALRDQHRDYFVRHVAAQYETVIGAHQSAVLQSLSRDDANLSLAWDAAVEQKNVASLQTLLPALHRYANFVSRTSAWLPRYESALLVFTSCRDADYLCVMLRSRVAACLNFTGEYERARALLQEQVIPHLASVNFQDVVGRGEALPRPYVYNTSVELDFAHLLLGNGYLAQGKLAEAQAAFAHAIESTDAYIAGATTGNMSIVDTRLGNYTQAIAGQIKRLAQTQANQDVRNAAIAALNLGEAYYKQANMAQSENYLREAQRLFAQTHDQIGQAMSAGNFGELLMELKRLDEAEPALQRALRMFRQVGYRHMVCSTLGSLGKLAALRNQFEEAAPLLADCLSMGQAIGANDQLALCHQTLADIALAQGDLTTARASLCAALQAARDGGEHRYQQDCVLRLAQLDARENRHQQAQHGLATLKADADLPEDLRVEIEKLTQSLPNTSAPSTPLALDEWIAELLST